MKIHNLRNKFLLGLIAIISFGLISCEEPDIIGSDIQPKGDKLNMLFSDTISLVSFSLLDDSVKSDETNGNLLGSYKDPVFGTVKASFYTQIRLSSSNVKFDSLPVVDSIVLSLVYSGYYGDITIPQNIKVYEITENFYRDSSYYSNHLLNHSSTWLASQTFIPKPKDSVMVDGVKGKPQLRIHLDKSLGQKLLDQSGTANLENNDNFIKFFKGIYVEALSSMDKGAILYFDLIHPASKLTLYYHNTKDTTTYSFLINENCARFNSISHLNYSDAFPHLKNQVLNKDSITGQDLFYIQGLAGIKGKIKFPYIKSVVNDGMIAINKAELIIPIYDLDPDLATLEPPARLGLVRLNENGITYFLPDFSFGDAYFGGYYDAVNKQYKFTISRHIQNLISGKEIDYGLQLVADQRQVKANRVVLRGAKNFTRKMRLEITYTKLN